MNPLTPSWEYRNSARTENEFSMYLSFEEDLTLGALRAFVAQTANLGDETYVEVGDLPRQGHETVVVLIARRTSFEHWPCEGPQPSESSEAPMPTKSGMAELDCALMQSAPEGGAR